MVILENNYIKVEIEEKGAEIRRLIVDGEDRFWNGNPKYWKGVAPVLFPICGGLKDDKFITNGKEYNLEKHGFARHKEFTVESIGKTFAIFVLKSDEETLKSYPWEFEFRIKYTLVNKAVKVSYEVKNLSNDIMYTAVGGHEAYACPEGIEDYDIIFEKNETLNALVLNGNLLTGETKPILCESNTLPLYYKDFENDALVFTDLKSRFVTLRNRKTGKTVSVAFPESDFLLLWTIPTAEYICIEPWTSCPSFTYDNYEIGEKLGMTKVLPNATFSNTHTIYF